METQEIKYVEKDGTYTLTESMALSWPGQDFGKWRAYGRGRSMGKLFIQANGDTVSVHKGYSWDGCTGVPTSDWNLRASLIHDALYQAKKCGADTLSWRKIDSLFRIMMKQDGADLFHRNLYYYGVKSIGFWWKLGTLDSLRIVPN